MTTWQQDLEKAVAYHGHLCGGQIMGVRMARKGLELMGLAGKWGEELCDVIVFLEADRCMADAAYAVTGCTIGRRRVKVMPYGKTAMSFLDLNSGKAVRVYAKKGAPRPGPEDDLMEFWSKMTDEQIMGWQEVEIKLPPEELPGKPVGACTCQACGDDIMDRREVSVDGRTLCRACAGPAYYRPIGGSAS